MAYTVSFHNGSEVHRQHNIRNPKIVSKEGHIKNNGHHETWIDVPERDAYKSLFGDAVAQYNESHKPSLRITDYYQDIKKDSRKHTSYETIVTIGDKDNHPDDETLKDILFNYCANWEERNPNLELIGAYYHADEEGVPHIHCDYIPHADGYKKGLSVRSSASRAFKEMGFIGDSSHKTPQILWEERERTYIEGLCHERGLETCRLEKKTEHLETEEYKLSKELERTQEELNKCQKELNKTRERTAEVENQYNEVCAAVNEAYKQKNALEDTYLNLKKHRGFLNRVLISYPEYESLKDNSTAWKDYEDQCNHLEERERKAKEREDNAIDLESRHSARSLEEKLEFDKVKGELEDISRDNTDMWKFLGTIERTDSEGNRYTAQDRYRQMYPERFREHSKDINDPEVPGI